MAETLGEALLILRTDDRGLESGIERTEPKARNLGRTLDATSGSSTKLAQAMSEAGNSATRLGNEQAKVTTVSGAQRAGMQQLGMQINDVATMYTLGARPMQIWASQSGQVFQAVQMMTGGTSRLASFLGGPWGLAISTASIVLVPLIGNLLSTEEATDKAKDSTLDFTRVLDFRKMSVIEFKDAIDKLNDSTKSLMNTQAIALDNQALNAQKAVTEAQRRLTLIDRAIAMGGDVGAVARGARPQALADLEKARRSLDETRSELQARAIDESIDRSKGERAEIERQIARLKEMNAESRAIDRMNPTARAYAIRQAGDNYISAADYERRTRGLSQRLHDQREEGRSANSGNQRAASVGDMVALIKSLFPNAVVTSTTGGKHTKGSDHYAGRAIDFVVPGMMNAEGTAQVERTLEEAGVTIRRNASGRKQFFGPGRGASKPGDHDSHFHAAWSGSASPEEAERKREQAEARREREKEQEARRVERYNRDLAGLQDAALDLQARLAETSEERYRLESDGLEIAIAEQRRRIEANADYSDAEKKILLAALEKKASMERELLERRREEELARQQLEVAQAMRANQRDLLQAETRLADTREERRDVELRLLDLTYEQERAALDAVIASRESTDAQRAIARARLGLLDRLKGGDRAAIDREFESPLERYRREVGDVGKNINDEMEGVAVNGLNQLNQSLTDVIVNAKSLGGAFKAVADQIIAELARIAIQQAIIGPLMNLLGMGGGGGLGGFLGDLVGGKGLSNGGAGLKSGFKNAGFFADGGLIPNGSFGIVGEAGPEAIFATNGGVGVMPNSALRDFGGAAGPSISMPISIDATGADPAALARVQASVDRLRSELPGQIVRTVQDAGDRRLFTARSWS